MKIIDIHTHVYPDDIAAKAAGSIRTFYGTDDNQDGTCATLLRRGTEAGISRFVILPVAIKADKVRSINHFITETAAANDRFIGFGTLHAAMEDAPGEVDRILDAGLKGIKVHPDCQKFAIDDPRLFPVYEAIQGRLPVMYHMGDQRFDFSHPQRLRRVLEQFPRLQTIAAHFGGYTMYETAREYLYDTDCIMDISSSLMFMPQGTAEKYIRLYGAERMAYGTDYPLWDPVNEVRQFLNLDLTDEEKEQIAWKTASRFLNLEP